MFEFEVLYQNLISDRLQETLGSLLEASGESLGGCRRLWEAPGGSPRGYQKLWQALVGSAGGAPGLQKKNRDFSREGVDFSQNYLANLMGGIDFDDNYLAKRMRGVNIHKKYLAN